MDPSKETAGSKAQVGTSADTATHQPRGAAATTRGHSAEGQIPVDDVEMEDAESSSSDISMSSASDGASDASEGDISRQNRPVNKDSASTTNDDGLLHAEQAKKRKSQAAQDTSSLKLTKKVKLDRGTPTSMGNSLPLDRSLLPPEIWHHVFTFTPPKMLGKLLQTNKVFNVYLDRSSTLQCSLPEPSSRGHAAVLQPDAIWQASRRRLYPKMPTPLRDMTELDMWRLVCGRHCQYCGRASRATTESRDKLQPDPGTDGVRIVWPFSIKSCGPCLISHSVKDVDLLLSSTFPAALLSALSYVLITKELHVLSARALRNGHSAEPLTKFFLSKHVDDINNELCCVKAMGDATLEEWLKGLEDRGKECRNDSARWEKWEVSGGVAEMQANVEKHVAVALSSTSGQGHTSIPQSTGLDTSPQPQIPCQSLKSQRTHQPKARTQKEADEFKAARRAEIERRAMLLDRPLPPNVLAHIPAFQAALQIIMPLDDAAWDLLKPRLLAQRADAERREQREQELAAHSRIVQERTEERRALEGDSSKKVSDKDWDDVQAPLRAQISAYADEIIRDGWDKGSKVDKENSPKFAAEVLIYVRKRFYAEIGKDATARRAAGQEPLLDPLEGPFTQKLTLENMRWVFEMKIKPHTDHTNRKELFLCNDCEGTQKAYGFEGVVQHYAAKHTSSLSHGSVVVHWRSEWPQKPPFSPNLLSKHLPARNSTNKALPAGRHPQYRANMHPSAPIPSRPLPYAPIDSGYGGPYEPLGVPVSQQHAYGPAGPYTTGHIPYSHPFTQPTAYGHLYNSVQPPFSGSIQSVSPGFHPQSAAPANFYPLGGEYSQTNTVCAFQHNGQAGFHSAPGIPPPDKVRAQLDDVARNSRQVWTTLAGLKELPGNIRVYVVLHHLAKRYRSRFVESPPLAMFIDGLSNNSQMRPVRNVNGLMCKACQLHLGNGTSVDEERSTFSLPQLVNHFQQKHVAPLEPMGSPALDWTIDMVHVPDLSGLLKLRNMHGMDDHKYSLVNDAFPHILEPLDEYQNFGGPAPSIGWDGSTVQPHPQVPANPGVLPPIGAYQDQTLRPQTEIGATTGYDPHRPGLYHHQAQAPMPIGDQTNMGTLSVNGVYTPAQMVPQKSRGHSRKISPDRRQTSRNKNRHRKSAAKDRKATTKQGDESRRGSARSRMEASTTNNEDKLAEEEARRQEEQIRAMWANDRRETARVYPVPAARAEQSDASISGSDSKPAVQGSPSPSRDSPPALLSDDGADDLFAGLESHLNQQQQDTSNKASRGPRPNPLAAGAYEVRTGATTAEEIESGAPAVYEAWPAPVGAAKPIAAYEPWVVRGRQSSFTRDHHVLRHTSHADGRSQSPVSRWPGTAPHTQGTRSRSPVFVRQDAQARSRSPVYVRHASQARWRSPAFLPHGTEAPMARFRERSPVISPTEPVLYEHHRALTPGYTSRPRPAVRGRLYEMTSPQHVDDERGLAASFSARESTYESRATRVPATAQYEEAYELVEVRGPQGSYFVRQPLPALMRVQPPVYTNYEDERSTYRQDGAYYDQGYYDRRPIHEPVSNAEHGFSYDERATRTEAIAARERTYPKAYEGPSGDDTALNEEYDPRFPAARSSAAVPGRTRYEY